MFSTNKLTFHEDDYKQTELIPRENFFRVKKELSKLDIKSSENFSKNGYSEMHSREPSYVPLEVKKIPKEGFYLALKEESIIFLMKYLRGILRMQKK